MEVLSLGVQIGVGFATFVGSVLGSYMAIQTRLALVEQKANDAKEIALDNARSLDRHVALYHVHNLSEKA